MAVYEKEDNVTNNPGAHDDLGVSLAQRKAEAAQPADGYNKSPLDKSGTRAAEENPGSPRVGSYGNRELGKLQDIVGRGYNTNAATGMMINRIGNALWGSKRQKKRAIGAGIGGFAVTTFMIIAGIASGPLEFIQLAQLLDDIHFGAQNDASDDRFRKAVQYLHSGGKAERTRMGVIGNKFGDKFEAKLNKSGLKSAYSPVFGLTEGYVVDKDNPKYQGLTDEEIREKVKAEFGIDPGSPEADGTMRIRPDRQNSYRQNMKLNRAALKSAGYGKITAAIGARTMGKRAGINWHPLQKLDDAAKRSAEARIKAWREKREADVKEGAAQFDTTKSTSSGEDSTEDEKRADSEAGQAEASADETVADAQSDPDAAEQSIKDKIGKGVGGPAAIAGILCLAKGIDDDAKNLKLAQVILPLMRISMTAIAIGSQLQYGDRTGETTTNKDGIQEVVAEASADISNDELSYNKDLMYGEDEQGNKTSWADSEAYRAEMGKTGGVKPSETLNEIGKGTPFSFLNSGAIDGPLNAVCSTAGGVVLTLLSFGGGPLTFIGGAILDLLVQKFVAGPITKELVKWLAGDAVDPFAAGGDFGNQVMFGSLLAANDAAVVSGGSKLSTDQKRELKTAQLEVDNYEFQQKNLAGRLFDIHDRKSFIAQVIDTQKPTPTDTIASLSKQSLSLTSLFNFNNVVANFTKPPTVAAAAETSATYDYGGLAKYGFSIDDMSNESVNNPYENAERAVGILESNDGGSYRSKAHDCFGIDIYQDGEGKWNVRNSAEESLNIYINDYENYNCNENSEAWRTIRFFIFDTSTMNAAACYEGEESICEEIGMSDGQLTTAQGAGTEFTIATYNQPARGDENKAAEKIKENQFDVVGMQEIYSQYRSLRTNLEQAGYKVYPDWPSGDIGRQCSSIRPIFYKSSKFSVVKSEVINFPREDDGGTCPGGEIVEQGKSNMPIVWLQDTSTGQEIIVMNTHNQAFSRGDEKRYKSALIYTEKIRQLQSENPGIPIFFTGDFNEGTGVRRENGTNTTYQFNHNNLLYCMFKKSGNMTMAIGANQQPCENDNEGIGGVDYIYTTPEVKVLSQGEFTDPSTNQGPHPVKYGRMLVPAAGSTVRAASFNIFHSSDPEAAWKARLKRSLNVLTSNNIDVAGLQEVRPDQMKTFNTSEYGGDIYDMWPKDTERPGYSPNPIVWNKSKFELVKTDTIPFKYFGGGQQQAPLITLRAKSSGQLFYVANTHDPAFPENAKLRYENAIFYKEFFSNLTKEGKPIIFTGDFNSGYTVRSNGNTTWQGNPKNLTYCILSQPQVGLWDAIDALDQRNINPDTCGQKGPGTNSVDHIFVSKNAGVSKYFTSPSGKQRNGSDVHDTIIADVLIRENPSDSAGQVSGDGFQWPISKSDYKVLSNCYRKPGHTGIDIPVGGGTAVFAAASGQVVQSGNGGDAGNYIMIKHGGGKWSNYQHLSRIVKHSGTVNAGELIGYSGNTGYSSGAHLHFSITTQAGLDSRTRVAYSLNPLNFLPKDRELGGCRS